MASGGEHAMKSGNDPRPQSADLPSGRPPGCCTRPSRSAGLLTSLRADGHKAVEIGSKKPSKRQDVECRDLPGEVNPVK